MRSSATGRCCTPSRKAMSACPQRSSCIWCASLWSAAAAPGNVEKRAKSGSGPWFPSRKASSSSSPSIMPSGSIAAASSPKMWWQMIAGIRVLPSVSLTALYPRYAPSRRVRTLSYRSSGFGLLADCERGISGSGKSRHNRAALSEGKRNEQRHSQGFP